MKTNAILALLLLASTSSAFGAAENDLVVLDLAKATPKLTFNDGTGAWSETYSEEIESLDIECFSLAHHAMADWNTWWDFTASNSADNSRRSDFITYQFSNMAKGGIVMNEDGTIKTDAYGAPVVSADVPYVVGYYDFYFSKRPCDLTFTDGKPREAVSMYVNLNSWVYYTVLDGDGGMARPFNNGDSLTFTIVGVAPNGTEKTIETKLASYENGDITINRGWKYVDLSPLGIVNEIYFKIGSTDMGEYGCNTPGFFCLDKLTVRNVDEATTAEISSLSEGITYDRASKTINVETGAGFAAVYDAVGNLLSSSNESEFSIASLPAGVYVVRSGSSSLKIMK